MRPSAIASLSIVALLSNLACATARGKPPPRTVERVDLQRYVGTWYEIARLPHPPEKDCRASRATYSLRTDGDIDILNECTRIAPPGEKKQARGKAWVVDPATNARLKVSFFWPFRGDYWVIDLDPEYRWVAVGEPARRYLWILSRTPQLDEAALQGILERARAQGYDLSKLIRDAQGE